MLCLSSLPLWAISDYLSVLDPNSQSYLSLILSVGPSQICLSLGLNKYCYGRPVIALVLATLFSLDNLLSGCCLHN